jgi:hypothetical protein
MPLRQIQKTYTKSEMAMMGWRSAEMSANMRSRVGEPSKVGPRAVRDVYEAAGTAVDPKELERIEAKLGPTVIANMQDEETGEIDLRKLTGEEAMRYMGAMGIQIGRRV